MCDTICMLKKYLPLVLYDSIEHLATQQRKEISEIRLRLERPSSVTIRNKNVLLIDYSCGNPIILNDVDMALCFKKICENSIYKYENEIKNGYITLHGGCRVGFCGTRTEGGFIKDVSSISFRVSKSIADAASEIYPLLTEHGRICSSLIISRPCAGKTTILTDISCKLANDGYRVAIVDERCEIAAVYKGKPQKDVGKLCDVLDNYPKGEGMMIALRSLSPQVLICDEIGSSEDVNAMIQAMNAGVPVIASAHADDAQGFLLRPQLKFLVDSGAAEKLFFLEGPHRPGKLKQVLSVKELYENFRDHSAVCRSDPKCKTLHSLST